MLNLTKCGVAHAIMKLIDGGMFNIFYIKACLKKNFGGAKVQ